MSFSVRSGIADVRIGVRLAMVAACALFVSGCCPGGAVVLGGLTLPEEQQSETCRLVSGPTLTWDPYKLMGGVQDRIPDRSTAAAVVELVGRPGSETAKGRGVKYVYAAEYACDSGDGLVGVAAVMFREPADAAQAAALRASPMGIMFKGQLAAVVWTSRQDCEDCFRVLHERAERIVGREQ